MNRIVRSFIVPSLAVVGSLVSMPGLAHAEEHRGAEHGDRDRDRDRDRERVERERREREQRERIERERIARERIERERIERERHQLACTRAYENGASRSHLREMGCWVR